MDRCNAKPEPYPEIKCSGNNQHDIQLIRPLYTGNVSELTAILQYEYQHVILEEKCQEVSRALSEIAMVEMRHLHLLANAICTMGGDPRYVNPNTRSWWNAGTVSYEQTMCKLLLINLKSETEAHNDYLSIARKVKNPSLCALLNRIAQDEKQHMEIFTNLINCHCRKP